MHQVTRGRSFLKWKQTNNLTKKKKPDNEVMREIKRDGPARNQQV